MRLLSGGPTYPTLKWVHAFMSASIVEWTIVQVFFFVVTWSFLCRYVSSESPNPPKNNPQKGNRRTDKRSRDLSRLSMYTRISNFLHASICPSFFCCSLYSPFHSLTPPRACTHNTSGANSMWGANQGQEDDCVQKEEKKGIQAKDGLPQTTDCTSNNRHSEGIGI